MIFRHTLLILFSLSIFVGCNSQYPDLEKGLYADILTANGSILLKLESEKTPITVANFVSLAEGNNPFVSEQYKDKPFYDGLVFHRVMSNFMIQGGDPLGTGQGNPGYRFDDEITDLKHDGPGILSMANGGPATNGSQFFITHNETPWLDGIHTVFGHVVSGQEVVDNIAQNDTIQKVSIIRVGRTAKKFDAPEVFSEYFEQKDKLAAEKEARINDVKAQTVERHLAQKNEAKTTASGLQYLITEEGTGAAVTTTNKAKVHYAVYFEDGTLLDTSMLEVAELYETVNIARKNAGQYLPLDTDVRPEARLIPGFKEGVGLLKAGDKAVLFLPYTLAYGAEGGNGIPPQSNLIFEVTIVELIQ